MTQALQTRSSAAPVYDARHLLSGQQTVQLVLDEFVYTLRITKAGKLILTK